MDFGILYEVEVVLVYWILDKFMFYVCEVWFCGIWVIIVGVGGVVYFFGMFVLMMLLLVVGVLVLFVYFDGMDLLFLIV